MGRIIRHLDVTLTAILLAIGCFGLGIIFTIDTTLFFQQLIFLAIGCALMVFCTFLDPILLSFFSPILYAISVIFIAFSYLGPNIRGATRWIMIGGNQLQPSELVKPFVLLGFAYAISKYPPRNMKNILFHTVLFIIPFFLVLRQPDLGSAIVYGVMWGAMLVAGGLPMWTLLIGLVGLVAGIPFFWRLLAPYQQGRILTFLNPTADPAGAGYNALQSMIAVGSGQLFGKGLGLGTQSHLRFLPEFHTDFIFATLVEELGFVGGAFLLILYALLLWKVCRPFVRGEIDSSFVFIYSAGLVFMILSQVVINTGMNMGLVPITGITLPLVTYGGSSLLSVMTSFGIFMALIRHSKVDL